MDEPESMGAITMPVREKLDNLVFVINCNLQRLDGPVRGNGKIIQELEAAFLGAGWNVIKVIWGSRWDPLLARDTKGLLRRVMEECVDGEYQNFKAKGGAYTRENFFGKYPELKEMVANMSDDDIWRLNRGGHDCKKVCNAYHAADEPQGPADRDPREDRQGLRHGQGGRRPEHHAPAEEARRRGAASDFRDRFNIPISDEEIANVAVLEAGRRQRGDEIPARAPQGARRLSAAARAPARRPLAVPALEAFEPLLAGLGRSRDLHHDGVRAHPHDAASRTRTSASTSCRSCPTKRAPSAWKACSARSASIRSVGQLYTPQDADQLHVLPRGQEGPDARGRHQRGRLDCARGSRRARRTRTTASTWCRSTSTTRCSASSASATSSGRRATCQARGFLIGGTAGRTTLAGEGLQHQDGHSQLLATTVPNCVAYDPTFAYELAVIIQDGLRRMFAEQEDVFYYITCMNENYAHPAMPKGVEAGHPQGHVPAAERRARQGAREPARLRHDPARGASTAAEMLEQRLRRAGGRLQRAELLGAAARGARRRALEPAASRRSRAQQPYVRQCLGDRTGPFIAATRLHAIVPDQIRQWVPGRFIVLGTDGYGRSDSRAQLRGIFEVDAQHIVLASLQGARRRRQARLATVQVAHRRSSASIPRSRTR